MPGGPTFCCLDSRLLQAPTEECRECGSALIAAVEHEDDVLKRACKRQRGKVANAAVKTDITFGAVGAYGGAVAGGALLSPFITASATASSSVAH